jgi:hypothetical protein
MRYRDFKRKFSLRSDGHFHASKLEAGALGVAIRIHARQAKWHRQRALFLVDAKALQYAARKGRSSARNFVNGLRGIAATSIAADLRLHFGYIASAHNPGDPPSRGLINKQRLKGCGSNSSKTSASSSFVKHIHFLKRSIRRFIACGTMRASSECQTWSSSCSSSTLTQPSFRC